MQIDALIPVAFFLFKHITSGLSNNRSFNEREKTYYVYFHMIFTILTILYHFSILMKLTKKTRKTDKKATKVTSDWQDQLKLTKNLHKKMNIYINRQENNKKATKLT